MNEQSNDNPAREQAERLVAERGLDWIGYDGENLVSDAVCRESPEVVREMLLIYKENGRDPIGELNEGDYDGITGRSLAIKKKELWPILEEFGVEVYRPDLLPEVPAPDSDVYDIYRKQVESGVWTKRVAVQQMATLAYERHKGQYRKWPDGRPYIVHPQAVYDMLYKKWGYTEENDVVSLCVAWGHDLLEDAEPRTPENREAIGKEVVAAGGKWGEEVLTGIRALSLIIPKGLSDKEYDDKKNDYMEGIAKNAPLEVLAVKMADRLCNTLDFAQSDKGKARGYLGKGMCLFRRLDQMPRPDLIRKSLAKVEVTIREE